MKDRVPEGVAMLATIKLLRFHALRAKPEYRHLSANELCDLEERGGDVVESAFDFSSVADLIAEGELDLVAFEALRRLAVLALRAGVELPAPLAGWTADYLDGKAKPPRARPGKHPSANLARDVAICMEVHRLVKQEGMTPTRNIESPPNSACDVVAGRRRMTYSAVEKVWLRYTHLRPSE